MAKMFETTEDLIQELERLSNNDDVRRGRKYLADKNKLRQRIYTLRHLEKIGKALAELEEIEKELETDGGTQDVCKDNSAI